MQKKLTLSAIFSSWALTRPTIIQPFAFHLSHIQLLAILIQNQIWSLFPGQNNSFVIFTKRLADIVVLHPFLQENYITWIYSAALICIWIYLTVILSVFIYFTLQSSKSKDQPSVLQVYFAQILHLHATVIFWITTMILLIPWLIKAQHITTINIMNELNIDNDILALVNLVFIGITLLIGSIASLMCVDYFNNNNLYAVREASEQCLVFAIKVISAVSLLMRSREHVWIHTLITIAGLLVCTVRYCLLLRKMPYYYYRIMKISLILSCSETFILLVNCVIPLLSDYTLSELGLSIFYGEVLVLPVIIKYNNTYFDKILESYSAVPIKNLKTENEVYKKALSQQKLIESSRNNSCSLSRLCIIGNLKQHLEECQNTKCRCRSQQERNLVLLNFDTNSSFEEYSKILSYILLEEATKNIQASRNLKLNFINEVLQSQDNQFIKLFTDLQTILQDSGLYVQVKQTILFRKLQSQLENSFSQADKGILEAKKVIEFHNDKKLCTDLLASNANKFVSFWCYYNQVNFKIMELFSRGIAIEEEADKIERLYESYMSKYADLYHSFGEDYCIYLALVRNRPLAALKFHEKYSWRKKYEKPITAPLTSFSVSSMSADTAIINISMSRKTRGKIIYASFGGAENVLGYEKKDLLGKDINILLSPSLSEKHSQLMNDHIQLTEINNIKVHAMDTYVRHIDDYIVPCSIYVTIFPHLQDDLTYACILRPQEETKYQYIMFTKEGLIEGMSKGLKQKFGLLSQRKTYVKDICSGETSRLDEWQKLSFFFQENKNAKDSRTNLFRYEGKVTSQTIMSKQMFIITLKEDHETEKDLDIFTIPEEGSARTIIQNQKPILARENGDFRDNKVAMKDLLSPLSPRNTLMSMQSFTEQSENAILVSKTRREIQKQIPKPTESTDVNAKINLAEVKSQIEYGAYAVPSKKLVRAIIIVVVTALIVCMTLLFVSGQIIQDRLVFIRQNINILNVATVRQQQIIQLGRAILGRHMITTNLMKDDRYVIPFGMPSFRDQLPPPKVREQTLNSNNTLLRSLINQIDPSLQTEIYSIIVPMINNDNQTTYMNIFDAAVELTLKAKKLGVISNLTIERDELYIQFILRNVFNELLVGSERVSGIILEDSERNLDNLNDFCLSLWIGLSIIGVCLFALLIFKQNQLKKERNRLINQFLFVEEQDMNQVLAQVTEFIQTLDPAQVKAKTAFINNRRQALTHSYQKKIINFNGLNFRHSFMTGLGFILLLTILLPFLVNFLLMKDKTAFFKNKMKAVVDLNTHPYEMQLLHASLSYHIIPEGLQLIRTRPFEEEWEALFKRRSTMHTVLFDLQRTLEKENTCSESTMQSIHDLDTGNICAIFPKLNVAYRCTTIAGGANLRGIHGMLDYSLVTLRAMKDQFENSNRTAAAATEILDSIDNTYIENILPTWHSAAFQRLNLLISECNDTELKRLQGRLNVYWGLYILFYVCVAGIVVQWWRKILDKEIFGWKKLMRKIPIEIILKQNTLKMYIQKH